ncbi:hypothetical protein AA313_de0200887 [Arthrobotrys entomopaga]|nr:hypothetical protein AA313_de0200887 [Arthrobotrys entomopaga]
MSSRRHILDPYYGDGVYEQPRLTYDTHPYHTVTNNPFFTPTYTPNLGLQTPLSNESYYRSENWYPMVPFTPSNVLGIGHALGSEYNPIVLPSDDNTIRCSALQIPRHTSSPSYIDLTQAAEAPQTSRKRKIEHLQDDQAYSFERTEESTTKRHNPQWTGHYTTDTNGWRISASSPKTPAMPQDGFWDTQQLHDPFHSSSSSSSFIPIPTNIIPSDKNHSLDQFPPGGISGSNTDLGTEMSDLVFRPSRFNTAPARSGTDRRTSPAVPQPIPEDLKRVQEYFHSFLSRQRTLALPCPHFVSGLAGILSAIKNEDRKKGSQVLYNQENKLCYFKCGECRSSVCLGCAAKLGNAKTEGTRTHLDHQCIEGHLLSIVLVLARIDTRWQLKEFGSSSLYPLRKPSALSRFRKTAEVPVEGNRLVIPSGRANSSPHRSGIGYGSGSTNRRGVASSSKQVVKTPAKLRVESEDNQLLAEFLSTLTALLETQDDDLSVITLLAEHGPFLISSMKVSYLPELIRSLVRNDSIMDIDAADTWDLYKACMGLLRTLADHEPLLDILFYALDEKKTSPGLANLIKLPHVAPLRGLASGKKRFGLISAPQPIPIAIVEFALISGPEGVAQPIIQSFQKLVKQCQAFMSNASRVTTNDDEETNRLLAFCIDVDSTAIKLQCTENLWQKKLADSRPPPAARNSHLASLSPEILSHPIFSSLWSSQTVTSSNPLDVPIHIKQKCKQALTSHLQFKFATNVVNTHCGASQLAQMEDAVAVAIVSGTSNPGRMKRLIKELTVLSTTLPPGIFVRVQEDRPDLFKAIIIGPDSSPYHLGLYEFDFTIPPSYPNVPPKVSFKTTGGGRVRFNPNLYECGKVCLSILGTWSGSASEQWQPKNSTLLQVLVSIQSMILCGEPYYNEPGYQNHPDATASRTYNQNVQHNSIRLAMTDWLSYDGLWNDVIQTHFLANTEEILSTTLNFVNGMTPPIPSNINNPPAQVHNNANHHPTNPSDGSFFPMPPPPPPPPPFTTANAGFGNTAVGGAHPTVYNMMQVARDELENGMKQKLPSFAEAELWRET